ncbi:Eco29kI family restriction endonuclease, partial [Corallococcus praedator]
VGKAIPPGGRKGVNPLGSVPGRFLHGRLREHAESIAAARNLDLADFQCRYLSVDDIWIPLGETLLIAKFRPVWNLVLDGFGNHDPGSGRYGGLMPLWDVLHPGRAWATRCQPRPETAETLARRVTEFLRGNVPSDPHM